MDALTHFAEPTVADLFCGAGGLSLGLKWAGFRPACAVDHLPAAVRTYRDNVGCHVRIEEISQATQFAKTDVVAGGPPCQGFSSAGLRRSQDARNSLVRVFSTLVAREKPTAFVFENVEGFLTTDEGDRVLDLLDPLITAGYRVHLRKINAANYGVPQHRKRVVALGGLGWNPPFPSPTHVAFGAPGAKLGGGRDLPLAPSLMDAIGDLPLASRDGDVPNLEDHIFKPLSDELGKRAELLKQGESMRDLPEKYLAQEL